MADWRPELTEIDDPVAENRWSYVASDGSKKVSQIRVGHPKPLPAGKETGWYCPLLIEGHTNGIKPVMGVGPVDALMNAMILVRRFYESVSEVEPVD